MLAFAALLLASNPALTVDTPHSLAGIAALAAPPAPTSAAPVNVTAPVTAPVTVTGLPTAQMAPVQLGSATSGGISPQGAAGAVLLLAGGAAAAFVQKKRKQTARTLKLIDSLSVGRNRSIMVLEVDGRRLIVGSSEAGIHVLREESANARAVPTLPAESSAISSLFGERKAPELQSAAANEPRFTVDLGVSDEGEALRQKINARRNG